MGWINDPHLWRNVEWKMLFFWGWDKSNQRTSITFFFSISLSTATDKSLVCSLQQSADWGFESQFSPKTNPDNFPQTSSPISVLNWILISPIYCRVWRVQQTLACPKQLSTLDEPPVSNFVLKTHPALFCAWDGWFQEEDLFLFSILDSTKHQEFSSRNFSANIPVSTLL